MNARSYRLTLAGLAVFLACASARTANAQISSAGLFERTLSVSGPVDLEVSTGSGRIVIRSGPAGSVKVRGEIRVYERWFWERDRDQVAPALEAAPPIEQSGNAIRIGRIKNPDYRNNVSISYEIVVPATTAVRSRTGSGSQEITGVDGPVDASTGSGRIRVSSVKTSVSANTGSGSIRAEGILGGLRARTGSGSITADGNPKDRWDLSTGSGSVSIRLPQEAAFDLDAHTGSGSVTVDHPITVTGRLRRNALSGSVRGGGVAMAVRTGSGSIRIE